MTDENNWNPMLIEEIEGDAKKLRRDNECSISWESKSRIYSETEV